MYKIKLPNFEGPFDLLLYFIKRDELNIYDIPISRITAEFLSYIRIMQQFDLELAGEFIVMASNLMYIKTQMLLPRQAPDEGEEIEDPRNQLVQSLLEYKQFKSAAADLAENAEEQKYTFYRTLFDADLQQVGAAGYKNATLFDLMKAFRKAVERNQAETVEHVVKLVPVKVEEKIEYIKGLLKNKSRVAFSEITRMKSRFHIVATFLAILELMKLQVIFCQQSDNFDEIFIVTRPGLN